MLDFNDKEVPTHRWFKPAEKNQFYATLKKASHILYDIQRYADPQSFTKIPDWLKKVIECSCSKKRGQTILLISIGIFLRIIENTEMHGNMMRMYELVKPQRNIDSN
jgi:hypothetical protein